MARLRLRLLIEVFVLFVAQASGRSEEHCDVENSECTEDNSLLSLHHHKSQRIMTSRESNAVKIYVMMSLTMVSLDGELIDPTGLYKNLTLIKQTGATGVMTDVWWGITEPEQGKYNFAPYLAFFRMCKELGLEVQIVTSFHQCCDVGDPCYIPLPEWIRKEEGIWYKNALVDETKAYISLFADNVPISGGCGLTPLQMYSNWLKVFKNQSEEYEDIIVEIMLGMGTDGELKYPSYQNPQNKWNFPGIGMYQASDQYALASLQAHATATGSPASWAEPPPAALTGNYNAFPGDTEWFKNYLGGYQTDRGKFFQNWYSDALTRHGNAMLKDARQTYGDSMRLSGKIAGVHWWYKTASHAAELTAGFNNANGVNGYGDIARSFATTQGSVIDFTCLEMTDASQNASYECGPQELVQQVMRATENAGIPFTGENALSFYDAGGYRQMLAYKPPSGYLDSVTYLRISDDLLEAKNLQTFTEFVKQAQDPAYVTPFSMPPE